MYTDKWYEDIFATAPPRAIKGEITPSYCAIPEEGVAHLKATYPKVRLIYIIRDPLRRMISSLTMGIRRRRRRHGAVDIAATAEEVLSKPNFFPMGDYQANITRWDSYFPDILYLPFGRVKTDPDGLLAEVERSIGVAPRTVHESASEPHHKGITVTLPDEIVTRLQRAAEPQRAFLERRFGADFVAQIT
jgi:hypothetical protein